MSGGNSQLREISYGLLQFCQNFIYTLHLRILNRQRKVLPKATSRQKTIELLIKRRDLYKRHKKSDASRNGKLQSHEHENASEYDFEKRDANVRFNPKLSGSRENITFVGGLLAKGKIVGKDRRRSVKSKWVLHLNQETKMAKGFRHDGKHASRA